MKPETRFDFVPKLALIGALCVAIIIAILSLLPGSDLPPQNMNDKLNHLIAYSVLSFLATLSYRNVSLGLVMALMVGYGVALEVAQGVMPYGRSASVLDALANSGGVVIGTVCALLAGRFLVKTRPGS